MEIVLAWSMGFLKLLQPCSFKNVVIYGLAEENSDMCEKKLEGIHKEQSRF